MTKEKERKERKQIKKKKERKKPISQPSFPEIYAFFSSFKKTQTLSPHRLEPLKIIGHILCATYAYSLIELFSQHMVG